jgi:hypothetical protein
MVNNIVTPFPYGSSVTNWYIFANVMLLHQQNVSSSNVINHFSAEAHPNLSETHDGTLQNFSSRSALLYGHKCVSTYIYFPFIILILLGARYYLFLAAKSMLIWIYRYESLHFLNFRHGLTVHISAYFASCMNKHYILEDLYLCRIFSF